MLQVARTALLRYLQSNAAGPPPSAALAASSGDTSRRPWHAGSGVLGVLVGSQPAVRFRSVLRDELPDTPRERGRRALVGAACKRPPRACSACSARIRTPPTERSPRGSERSPQSSPLVWNSHSRTTVTFPTRPSSKQKCTSSPRCAACRTACGHYRLQFLFKVFFHGMAHLHSSLVCERLLLPLLWIETFMMSELLLIR